MATNFGHIELITQNLDKAKDFYQKLFGWKVRDLPDMPYSLFNEQLSPTGGMMKSPEAGSESFWIPYIVTDDITGVTEKARTLGATIHREVMVAGQYGWLSIINDPTGATFGLWQPKMQPKPARKKSVARRAKSRPKRRRR
ncbi:MAG TPA: VOC family protein [Nitrospira sp.]|jgi:predicted enzyme related to lactoylglutathione lyase|nr:VOC family protein [Nitrospira sp.]